MIAANGHNRRTSIEAESLRAVEHAVVAAVAFKLVLIDEHGLTADHFDDTAARIALTGLHAFRRHFPEAEQAPASKLARFMLSVPSLTSLLRCNDAPVTPHTISQLELGEMLDSGWHTVGIAAANVETLKVQAFHREKRAFLVDLERFSGDPAAFELEARSRLDALQQLAGVKRVAAEIVSIGALIEKFPRLRLPVIDGIARQGEVINIVSKSKIGKSWLGYGLGLSIADGADWMGRFRCTQGKVLLIDNELHQENLAFRIAAVAEAMGIRQSRFHDTFHIWSLRGKLRTIFDLGEVLNDSIRGKYSVVIFDALYRMFPKGMSENDNAMMAEIYNVEDQYAAATDSVIVNIMHATKGDQSGKDVSDVGAGAGAQSRAADTHLILRPHEEDNCVALDAVVRSFAPVEPMVLRWNFPVWTPAEDLDPEALKGTRAAQSNEAAEKRLNAKREKVVAFLGSPDIRHIGAAKSKIKDHTGISHGLGEVLDSLMKDGNLQKCVVANPQNGVLSGAWILRPDGNSEGVAGQPDSSRTDELSVNNPPSGGRVGAHSLKGSVLLPPLFPDSTKGQTDGFSPEDNASNLRPNGNRRSVKKKPAATRKAGI